MRWNSKANFFVSFTRADEDCAKWIAWELQRSGYSFIIESVDFPPGSDFMRRMAKGLDACEQMIAVLSPAYLDSKYGRAELDTVLASDITGELGKLVPVRIEDCEPGAFMRNRVYIDLVKYPPAKLRDRLLEGIRAARLSLTASAKSSFTEPQGLPERFLNKTSSGRLSSDVSPTTFHRGQKSGILYLAPKMNFGLQFEDQFARIRKALRPLIAEKTVKLTGRLEVTRESLFREIHDNPSRVVHYSGKQNGRQIVLGTRDGLAVTIPETAMAGIFQNLNDSVQLVIIDTCRSDRSARAIVRLVDFAIGVRGSIYDEHATEFYEVFYKALGAGDNLLTSVKKAATALSIHRVAETAIPKLYCRPGADPRAFRLRD